MGSTKYMERECFSLMNGDIIRFFGVRVSCAHYVRGDRYFVWKNGGKYKSVAPNLAKKLVDQCRHCIDNAHIQGTGSSYIRVNPTDAGLLFQMGVITSRHLTNAQESSRDNHIVIPNVRFNETGKPYTLMVVPDELPIAIIKANGDVVFEEEKLTLW